MFQIRFLAKFPVGKPRLIKKRVEINQDIFQQTFDFAIFKSVRQTGFSFRTEKRPMQCNGNQNLNDEDVLSLNTNDSARRKKRSL